MKAKEIPGLLKAAVSDWIEDKATRLSAALAYYTAFSIVPLLVIVIFVAGLVIGEEAASGGIVRELSGLIGQESAEFFQGMVTKAREPGSGAAAILGIVLLLVGATGVFGQLKDGLNTVWEVAPKKGGGVLRFLRDRFLSFTMVMGIAFLLLVSLALSATLGAITGVVGGWLPGQEVLVWILNFLVSVAVFTGLFAMIFKWLPDVKMAWKDVWLGAAVTALLFALGKFAIGLYLGRGSVGSSFGGAGALAILLIWVYYSANILFLGAEITQVYAKRYGSDIVPADNAVPVTQEARARQGMVPSEVTQLPTRPLPALLAGPPPRMDVRPRAAPVRAVVAGFVAGILAAKALAREPDEDDLDLGADWSDQD
jgi:membrane protein